MSFDNDNITKAGPRSGVDPPKTCATPYVEGGLAGRVCAIFMCFYIM
jgi:hypothetical protein